MIGGASVMRGMVMMGVALITLCSFSLTLCSSSFTLCCVRGVAVKAGGVRMDLIFVCSFLMSSILLGVVPALVVMLANSLVSALKCWCGVRLGTWQCCGKSSVNPEILYALVLGTKLKLHR